MVLLMARRPAELNFENASIREFSTEIR